MGAHMGKRASHSTPTTPTPLVNAHTKGLYRDETFWIFHYPDPMARATAQVEHELACLDHDPKKAYDKLFAQFPDEEDDMEQEADPAFAYASDTEPPKTSWLGKLFSRS